jgi:hypothetical protein
MSIGMIMLLIAMVLFIIGTIPQSVIPINCVSLGLFFLTLATMLGSGFIKP